MRPKKRHGSKNEPCLLIFGVLGLNDIRFLQILRSECDSSASPLYAGAISAQGGFLYCLNGRGKGSIKADMTLNVTKEYAL